MESHETHISGILFLSFQKACLNLDFYVDKNTQQFLSGLTFDGWYPLDKYNELLETVSGKYTNPATILERLGEEMMAVWYHEGPGKGIVKIGIDFLHHQTGSEGYRSLIRGPEDTVGSFSLTSLDEETCSAVVHSTTPFSKDLERGILRAGIGLTGDLRLIKVDNSARQNEFLISYDQSPTTSLADQQAKTAEAFLSETVPVEECTLSGAALQEVYFRYQELSVALEKQKDYWQSTNQTLSDVLIQNQKQQEELRQTNTELAAATRKSNLLKNAIVDVAIDAVVTIDENLRILEFNPSAERIFGHARESVIETDAKEFLPAPILQAIDSTYSGEYRDTATADHIDGSKRPVEFSMRRVEVFGKYLFTAYIRDMSLLVEAEYEIERQREALVQSEKLTALGSLLAGVAHELNNPLAIVTGRAHLLAQSMDDPLVVRPLEKIQHAADRCTKIVRTFLAMARQQQPERRYVSINQIIEDSVEFLSYTFRTSGIDISLNLEPNLPDINADGAQLNQVFTNLLINAQQALLEIPEPRKIAITTSSLDDTKNGESISVEVQDNGPGIPEKIRRRIFEPFYTTKAAGSGTGVGLSLSHGLVLAHDGSIDLITDEGVGACFIVLLPRNTGTENLMEENEVVSHNSHSARILIVDDEIEFAEMVEDMLRIDRHTCTVVTSGDSALKMLETAEYDVILSDLNMPDIDGQQFHNQLKQQHPGYLDKIAFVTGDTLGNRARTFLTQPGIRYIEKPFTPSDIRELVSKVVLGGG